jgi:hypothetical protein
MWIVNSAYIWDIKFSIDAELTLTPENMAALEEDDEFWAAVSPDAALAAWILRNVCCVKMMWSRLNTTKTWIRWASKHHNCLLNPILVRASCISCFVSSGHHVLANVSQKGVMPSEIQKAFGTWIQTALGTFSLTDSEYYSRRFIVYSIASRAEAPYWTYNRAQIVVPSCT